MCEKCLFHFLLAVLSMLMMVPTVTAATAVSWSYAVDNRSRSGSPSREGTVQCTITEQLTEILSADQVLFIDYPNQSLYRVNQNLQQCVRHSFSKTPHQKTSEASELDVAVTTQLYNSLAAFSVRDSALWQQVEGIRCNKKTAIAGIHLLKQKTMVSKGIDYLGSSITETAGEYWVSDQLTGWSEMRAAFRAREQAFTDYPLLKRIDPLGLFSALGGFPIKGLEKNNAGVKEFILFEKPTLKVQEPELPRECRDSSP